MKPSNNCCPTGTSAVRRENAHNDAPPLDVSADTKSEFFDFKQESSQHKMVDNVLRQSKSCADPDPVYEKEFPPLSVSIGSGSKGKRRTRIDLRTQPEDGEPADAAGSLQLETSRTTNSTSQQDDSSLPTNFKMNRVSYSNRRPRLHQTSPEYVVETGNSYRTGYWPIHEPFDICPSKSRKSVELKPSWRVKKRENLTELEYSTEEFEPVLRPGMVLLKSYITLNEQVEIVNTCQELGLGPGGFYQPGYQDGAKLRLQMMCLGRNWDPQTKYEKQCRVDGSKPPGIPRAFILLVKKVLQDSQALIKKKLGASNVEDILPGMSPDICIVNFYTTNGRLGLHQDRDESRQSLLKELPVISFSVGDSAEFLYGDQRDVNKAEKVLLESGDVLIFGGKSRHIFHGVKSIVPNSAPPSLLNKSKLSPGRLNLTFRQF